MLQASSHFLFKALRPLHDIRIILFYSNLVYVPALMYASIFGNVSAIIQRLYSGTARLVGTGRDIGVSGARRIRRFWRVRLVRRVRRVRRLRRIR